MDVLVHQNLEIFARLLIAIILGGLIGLERQLAKKTAGLRTFSLVSLGAALFTIVSVLLSEKAMPNFNIAIIPAGIVTGIGFIGAGLIIFHGSHPQGITTAAGLWVSAAVGMAAGFGFYTLAVFAAFLAILIFVAFWFFEKKVLAKLIETSDNQ